MRGQDLARSPRSALTVIAILVGMHIAVTSILALVQGQPVATHVTTGPVSFEVPSTLVLQAQGSPTVLKDAATGVTVDVSELPPAALAEFRGPAFGEFLGTLGYQDVSFPKDALKRSGDYVYAVGTTPGAEGPDERFLLVLGDTARAAMITVFVSRQKLAAQPDTRRAIESLLSSAQMSPG